MMDSSVRVPTAPTSLAGKEVDCTSIEREGTIYYQQRVEAIGAAKEETTTETLALLGKILKELRMMNIHLASMTGEEFTMDDVQGD